MHRRNKIVLIIGADGFIGPHLTGALVKEGAKVKALSYYNSLNVCEYFKIVEIKHA
jgi:nucleoside-diphosphate-sugar epimerase